MSTYRIAFLFFLSFAGTVFSQSHSRIDSLNQLLLEENDPIIRGKVYLDLAKEFEYNDHLRSYDYLVKAREIASKYGNDNLQSKANLFFSNLLIKQGKYNEALTYLNNELSISNKENDGYKFVGLLINIGAIYYQIEELDKALKYFLEAKGLFENEQVIEEDDANYSQIYIGIYNNIANVYDELNDNPQALIYYKQALAVAKQYREYEHIGVISKNIGDLYIEMEKMSDALPYIKESIDARQRIEDYTGLATSYYVLGLYFSKGQHDDKAIDAYKQSLQYGLNSNAWLSIIETSQTLSELFKAKDDYQQTFEYFQIYHQYQDSLRMQNSTKQRMAIEFDYELKQRQQEWEVEQRRTRYLHLGIGVALFIIASYLLMLFSLAKAREKRIRLEKKNLQLENTGLEQDLKLKKKELTTNVMYLVRKNELMKEVSNRLMDSLGNLKAENKKVIHSIMVELQQGLDNDIWEEFEVRFNQVHSDFYDALRKHFPLLTPNEVKLSAFLRLNMSSKEISAITHQSIRSIEVARTRLRKKLQLTNTDIGLVNFLNQF